MKHLTLDFSQECGKIKPMHGVNNGPLTEDFAQDASRWFNEAHIPFSRLHDTEYPFGCGEFVDIDCLFKNWNADENDPSNYNFALTDEYLKAIAACGTKIIYRLGSSMEHQAVKAHVHPPKDNLKWARVCEHIILHYNEGWADGLHLGIEYWEIWNEPEEEGQWTGDYYDFFRFFTDVASYLKEKFPHLKIGSPALCSYGDDYFVPRFYAAITADGKHVPMDFIAWHCYTRDVQTIVKRESIVREVMEKYGYADAESICDEWNYAKDWTNMDETFHLIDSMVGTACTAAVMCAMQKTSCDILAYYDAQMKMENLWNGLFARGKAGVHGKAAEVTPKKTYYVFKAFGELYELGTEIKSEIEDGTVYACAAKNDERRAVLIANFRDADCPNEKLRICVSDDPDAEFEVYRLNRRYSLEKTGTVKNGGVLSIGGNNVVFLRR